MGAVWVQRSYRVLLCTVSMRMDAGYQLNGAALCSSRYLFTE